MSGNKLSSLSAEVGALRKLHRLIADNNMLTSIPGVASSICLSSLSLSLTFRASRKRQPPHANA